MKTKRVIFISVVLLLSVLSRAQLSNNVYLSLAGEYAGLLDNAQLAKPWLGGGAEFGFGYELQYNRFLLNLGFSAQASMMMSKIPDTQIDYDALDTEGESFVFSHFYHNNLNSSRVLYMNVPLHVGAMLGQNAYFLLGGKVGINVMGQTTVNSRLTTTATYPQYIGQMGDMSNHQLFTDKYFEGETLDTRFGLNVALGGEIGYTFNSFTRETGFDVPKSKIQYRIGLYGYYGILNIHPTSNGISSLGTAFSYSGGGDTEITYHLTHVYLSDDAISARVNPLTVGIRFTILFKLPAPKACVICRDMDMFYNAPSTRREQQRLIDSQP